MEKSNKLGSYREDPTFSDAERATLAFVEEISRTKATGEATFAEVRRIF